MINIQISYKIKIQNQYLKSLQVGSSFNKMSFNQSTQNAQNEQIRQNKQSLKGKKVIQLGQQWSKYQQLSQNIVSHSQTPKFQIENVQGIQLKSNGMIQLQNQSLNNYPEHKQKTHHSYKPEIDGLRAVAVIMVLIYHAWPEVLTGGFIGVDIFFVISGYLISSIILKQTKKEKFSYLDFYSRRIRRIYPALLVMMVFVFIVAFQKIVYKMQKQTYKKMAAASIFGANIQSMTKDIGYFNKDQKNNPLLHLWSLGVQEQFYIVWPVIISAISKYFNKKGLVILISFTLMSFIINIATAFQMDSNIAFYFPLSRFWQMSIGGIMAYQRIRIASKTVANILSAVGILTVILFSFLMTQKCIFPGFWALIPTLSAAFIILSGQQSFINKKILSSKVFVAIGKISYPLYLWHWPLLVFLRIFYPPGSKSLLTNPLIALLISLILSFLTYKLIQKPIRYKKGKRVVFILLIIMAFIGISSFYLISHLNDEPNIDLKLYVPGPNDYAVINGKKHPNTSKNPVRQKLTREKLQIAYWQLWNLPAKKIDQTSKYFYEKPVFGLDSYNVLNEGNQNQVFVIGDSHSGILTHRYYQLYLESQKQNKNFPTVVNIMSRGRPFFPSYEYHDFSMQMIKKHKPKRVVFANQWLFYLIQNDTRQSNIESYKNSIKSILDLGIQVSVAKIHYLASRINPDNAMDINGPIEDNIKSYKLSEFRNQNKHMIQPFQEAVLSAGGTWFDFADNLCWEDTCELLLPTGVPLMFDDNHYAKYAIQYWFTCLDFSVQF